MENIRSCNPVDLENKLTRKLVQAMCIRGQEAKAVNEDNIDIKDLPFYQDPQTYIELGGKKPWKKQ